MTLLVHGMHGLGDNLHQRAVLRQLMTVEPVALHTPWPSVYHDLVGPRLSLIRTTSTLRTQNKNARREQGHYQLSAAPPTARSLRIAYSPELVRSAGSVLGAMLQHCRVDAAHNDFRLPIPQAWQQRAQAWLDHWRPCKPLLIYRPLNERTEWGGCPARNPDHSAYATLIRSIRRDYFLLSVADLEDGKEWMVGEAIEADAICHRGELDFETLAALTSRASLVYSSPGFAIILAQAVGTPSVCVFGGYENGRSFSAGARHAAHLAIEPINSCQCFSHSHACDKRIDLPHALHQLRTFTHDLAPRFPVHA